jgi:hypothetical protein
MRIYLKILFFTALLSELSGQVGFDNRNWVVGRYYGDVTRIIPSMGYTVTYFGGLDFTKMPSDTFRLYTQDSTWWHPYWSGTDAMSSVLYVKNDSTIRYLNVIYGQLYSNDSLHLDLYSGGSYPYSYHYRMKKVKDYWGGCRMLNQSSVIACNSIKSIVNFTIDPLAVTPLSFTIQAPASCTGSYVVSSSVASPAFTLGCVGVNTIVVRDWNNALVGTFTHTVSMDTVLNITINTAKDTICEGESTSLGFNPGGISNIIWSEGSTASSVLVSPTVTTTYSFSALYTSGSRTCTAKGSKTIHVKSCAGIDELAKLNSISIYPVPASDKLYINNNWNLEIKKCILITVDGKEIPVHLVKDEISVNDVAEGIYFLRVQTDKGILTRKIIIQH